MKITREDVIQLAETAGYGIQYTGYPTDEPTKVGRWEKDIWGGVMETNRLHHFANLLIAKMEEENGPVSTQLRSA